MKKYMANQPYFIQGHRDVAARVKSGDRPVSLDITNGSQTNGPGPAAASKSRCRRRTRFQSSSPPAAS